MQSNCVREHNNFRGVPSHRYNDNIFQLRENHAGNDVRRYDHPVHGYTVLVCNMYVHCSSVYNKWRITFKYVHTSTFLVLLLAILDNRDDYFNTTSVRALLYLELSLLYFIRLYFICNSYFLYLHMVDDSTVDLEQSDGKHGQEYVHVNHTELLLGTFQLHLHFGNIRNVTYDHEQLQCCRSNEGDH